MVWRGNLPLLIVPTGVEFRTIKTILLPCNDETNPNPNMFGVLRDLAFIFKAYIEVLTALKSKNMSARISQKPTAAEDTLETLLPGTDHGYVFEDEAVIEERIFREITKCSADLLAMIPIIILFSLCFYIRTKPELYTCRRRLLY